MPQPSNDKVEHHYFELFRKVYALPEGSVAYGDKPDVVIEGPRKIGIEITNFHVQSGSLLESEQRQRPLREIVVSEAQNSYLAHGGKKIELTFGFDKANPIVPAKMKALSADLASLVRSLEGRDSGEIDRDQFLSEMPQVASIYFNAREYADAKWRIVQVHTMDLTSKDDLETIIREKESKSAEYETCDAQWLLIVVDGINPAQEQEIRIDNPHVHSDVFERIFLFHTFGHIVEVKGGLTSH